MCAIIALAVPSVFENEEACVQHFSEPDLDGERARRSAPDVRKMNMCSSTACTLRGNAAAIKLRKTLKQNKQDSLPWTSGNLDTWVKSGHITAARREDVVWGLAAATILNSGNQNDSLSDRVNLLIAGRFHRSHFPPEFFKKHANGIVDKVEHLWRSTKPADAVRVPGQIGDHAVERQMNTFHASLFPPTAIELDALKATGTSVRARRATVAAAAAAAAVADAAAGW